MLTKEPEMLQTDAFASIQCSKLRVRPRLCPESRWGSYSASPDPAAGFNESLRGFEGRATALKKGRRGLGREGKESRCWPMFECWLLSDAKRLPNRLNR